MGLDSYLYAEKYVSNYDHSSVQDKELYNKVAEAVGLTDFNSTCYGGNSVTVRLPLAYWRKANQIHKFFVDLTGEEDNCQDIEVSREDLETLLSKCKQILTGSDESLSEIDTRRLESVEELNGRISVLQEKLPESNDSERLNRILGELESSKEAIAALVKRTGTSSVDPSQILPTQGGFFFGSTDYDEYYYSDLEHTVQVLEKILNHPGIPKDDYSWSFIYRASW